MSNDDYTGLHGRDPYDTGHNETTGPDHFVPEHWEDLNRGICPRCGRTVVWDEAKDRWIPDPHLTVFVLTQEECEKLAALINDPAQVDSAAEKTREQLERQWDLNRPYAEQEGRW